MLGILYRLTRESQNIGDSMDNNELSIIRSDYYSALADFGYDHKTAREQTEDHSDLIDQDLMGIYRSKSEIEGTGIFVSRNVRDGDFICIARMGGRRTIAGRYTNHSPNPNGFMIFIERDVWIVAKREILSGEEITVDYRQALSLQLDDVGISIDVSIFKAERKMLRGPKAAAYDLLINEDHIGNLTLRERIEAFENILLKYPQEEIKTDHEFIDGLYRRTVTFPAGTLATGKIHPQDHMDVMLTGEMIVASDEGYKYLKAPLIMTSIAGKKKAGYALTEVIWSTYHPTKCTTIEEVEKEIFTNEYLEIEVI
jgi:hypothetical protein